MRLRYLLIFAKPILSSRWDIISLSQEYFSTSVYEMIMALISSSVRYLLKYASKCT